MLIISEGKAVGVALLGYDKLLARKKKTSTEKREEDGTNYSSKKLR
jgi:hypothetical protein